MAPATLITGGTIFIDSHFSERLATAGEVVLCLDNFYAGRKCNIRHLLSHPNFWLIRQDVRLPVYQGSDRIFNLACPASTAYYQHSLASITKAAVLDTMNMLGLAKRRNARILIKKRA